MKPDELAYNSAREREREGALSISLSLMIIKAWRDEISLMEDNIPAGGVVLLFDFPRKRQRSFKTKNFPPCLLFPSLLLRRRKTSGSATSTNYR